MAFAEKKMPKRVFIDGIDVEYKEPAGALWEIGKNVPTLGKWFHYYEIYEELFAEYRNTPVRILEIGVFKGDSIRMWKEYFGPDSVVVGLDIHPEPLTHNDPSNNVFVRKGDQSDHEFLAEVVEEFGQFDIILDDGGHRTSQQYMSFAYLFRNGLKDNGLYVVEDVHTSFWPEYCDSRHTFIETAAQLVDLMYAPYRNSDKSEDFVITNESALKMKMEYYEAWVHSIQFFDSIVCIRRRLRSVPVTPDIQFRLSDIE